MSSPLTYEQLLDTLSWWQCRRVAQLGGGLEIWETGWKEGFVLNAENGQYDHGDLPRIMLLIGTTVPETWPRKPNHPPLPDKGQYPYRG